jgi:hypothetical protein
MPHLHWVTWGTGTPKDRDEVKRRNVCEIVYYESIKRDLKIKPISKYRYDERLKTKAGESTRLDTLGCSGNWNT